MRIHVEFDVYLRENLTDEEVQRMVGDIVDDYAGKVENVTWEER